MDGVNITPELHFDDSTPETATASVVEVLVALQKALARPPLERPLREMEIVHLTAAACKLAYTLPTIPPKLGGAYNAELRLRFKQGISLFGLGSIDLGGMDLTLPTIGLTGALDPASVTVHWPMSNRQAIAALQDIWHDLMRRYTRVISS